MKQRVFRGLAGLTGALLCISIVTTSVLSGRESFLNSRLGTVSTKLSDTGEFATYFDSEFSSVTELMAAKEALAEQISAEGTVLLKNENAALPLDASSETVTLWGLNSMFPTLGGMIGSSEAASEAAGQKTYGIVDALGAKGFTLNQDMIGLYTSDAATAYMRRGFGGGGAPGHGLIPSFTATYEQPSVYMGGEASPDIYTDEVLASADNTAAVVVISRDNSEAADYETTMFNITEGDFFERPLALSVYEREMIALAKAHSTKVVVLINADNPMEIEELKQDPEIDSIVWTGLPGTYGFLGVADVLAGTTNPSGHLSDTYAVNSASAPAMVNFGLYQYNDNFNQAGANSVLTEADKAEWFVVEGEGIYIGYKYYETRYEDSVLGRGNATATEGTLSGEAWNYANEISYPFGYGLSYTTFEQTLDSVDLSVGGTGTATVTVTNTGDVAGKSVAQLYVQAPYTEGGIEKSAIQLVAYGKTQELAPGASETLTIEFDPQYIASYDKTAVKADGTQGAWVLEQGDYYFTIGNGAHEAVNNVIAAKTGSEAGLISVNADEVINTANVKTWNLAATDMETYSVNVQNQLTFADINEYLPGTVEYTTRTDWTKGWTTISTLDIAEGLVDGLKNQRYALNANGDAVTWGASNGLTLADAIQTDADGNFAGVSPLDDEIWDKLVDQITLDEAIRFIAYGGDDLEKLDSIVLPKSYMNDGPLGFAYDQVGGYGTRWTSTDSNDPNYVASSDPMASAAMPTMPTEPVVAATFNLELIGREGQLIGDDALWANESVIIAPGVNLHRAAYCARNHEYYSEDSMVVNYCASAFCRGAESKGLMTQCKHFAFNHQETNRSGISTFFDEQAGRENELRGFQGAMQNNLTSSSMTAFNRVGPDFAGGCAAILINIARNEWGYTGAFVTDMINGADYMNWRDTVIGGGGICLTETAYAQANIGLMESSKSDIAKDATFQQAMKDGIKYWIYNLAKSNAMNGINTDTQIIKVTPWYKTLAYTLDGVFGVLTALMIALYVKNGRKE